MSVKSHRNYKSLDVEYASARYLTSVLKNNNNPEDESG